MKLYATTRSERATKGQGGNNFLETIFKIGDAKNPRDICVVNLSREIDQVKLEIYVAEQGLKHTTCYVFPLNNKSECKHTNTKPNGLCNLCGYNTQGLTNKELKGKKQKGETFAPSRPDWVDDGSDITY